MTLDRYLEDKPLYYSKIDYTRMPRAYESIKDFFKLPKIIQIVGTNGKGSTGRFLADMLLGQGFSVGHYTSPHIFKFNERIWLNGKDIDDTTLQSSHVELQELLNDEFKKSLSYFEYTTFLAMLVFSKKCDFVVLEAGLGGEHDATTVFPKNLSVITPIGYDHADFLGESIEEIARTKIESITDCALISKQSNEVVFDIAREISSRKKAKLFFAQDLYTPAEEKKIKKLIQQTDMPSFQEINLQTAFAASKVLGFDIDLDTLKISSLNGRCQKIRDGITIDVGHNIMAAKALKNHFKARKIILIYNSFKDKEYKKIISALKPVILRLELLEIENQRGMAGVEIEQFCKEEGIKFSKFSKIEAGKEYLVFGSFVVVETFLRGDIN